MRKIIFATLLAFLAFGAMAGGSIDNLQRGEIPSNVDSLDEPVLDPAFAPVFMLDARGYPVDFNKWAVQNVTYPAIAVENGIQGRVLVGFIIERDGTMSNIKIKRYASYDLDQEAMKVVARSPKWHKPARGEDGRPVRMQFYVPIDFILSY